LKLEGGQPAPQFAVKDIYGRPISLANYAGSYLLLSFYRFAVCPLCNLRMWHLIRRFPDYQRQGLNILAFTESAPANAHGYLDRLQCPFPIVADLGSRVYAEYGLETSPFGVVRALLGRQAAYIEAARRNIGGWNILRMDGAFTRLPADFIIGPDQRIALAYYGRDSGDFLLFDDLDAFLRARPQWPPAPRAAAQPGMWSRPSMPSPPSYWSLPGAPSRPEAPSRPDSPSRPEAPPSPTLPPRPDPWSLPGASSRSRSPARPSMPTPPGARIAPAAPPRADLDHGRGWPDQWSQ
jgi:peroxiredoxin